MWRVAPISLAAVLVSAAFVCSADSPEHAPLQDVVSDDRNSLEIVIGTEKAVFRKISPRRYEIDYPVFYLLETEVTNRLYREYVRATGKRKDDADVLATRRQRRPKAYHREIKDGPVDQDGWQLVGEGRVITATISLGGHDYSIKGDKTIWRDGDYPPGLDDYPVALVTLDDATAFCEWLSKTYPGKGLFRLPTWNEWMIAAYGSSRSYPWGNKWDPALAHTSHGSSWAGRKTRAEPVSARPKGCTPEGVYGMLGNVSEYIVEGDITSDEYFNLGGRWMGGGFDDDGVSLGGADPAKPSPREDYWGYSHSTAYRADDIGFRVLLDIENDRGLITRPRLFPQKNNAWRMKSE
jgi:formylglycine-generating enzyme required for sulfatase activity